MASDALEKPCKIASTIAHLPGSLPSIPLPESLTKTAVVFAASALATSLQADAFNEDILTGDAFWRDQFTLTGNLRTFYGPKAIATAWSDLRSPANIRKVNVLADTVNLQPTWSTILFTFEADLSGVAAACQGLLYLVPAAAAEPGVKIWMLLTWLEDPILRPGQDLRLSPQHYQHPEPCSIDDLDVLIIGAGQSGLSTAAYCKSYGLKYVVLERNAHVGDNWTKRYDSAKLHTVKRFNDLSFGPTFTAEDPEWVTMQVLASGYQRFVERFGIDVWTSCELVEPATFIPVTKQWTAKIVCMGDHYTVTAHHIVLCTGPGGSVPLSPKCPGRESFGGTSLHSSEYKNPHAFQGKRAIVVGSANTAHDIVEDMVQAGLSEITMVQRGPTYVVTREHFKELFDNIWNDQMSQELSDRLFFSTPNGVSRLMTNAYFHPKADEECERWLGLEKAGFNLETKGDMIDHLMVRFGGHHMDCGASQLIADGKVKMKSDTLITHYTPTGLAFSDGSTLDADLIIWANGFEKDIRSSVEPVIGSELASQLRDFWGLNAEGEIKGAFVQSGVENCWMAGGGCAQARYFTRFVALQILFDRLGFPMKPYEKL